MYTILCYARPCYTTAWRTRMRANFVQPQLKPSRNRIEFEFLWDKDRWAHFWQRSVPRAYSTAII